jgi:hypothetical protein
MLLKTIINDKIVYNDVLKIKDKKIINIELNIFFAYVVLHIRYKILFASGTIFQIIQSSIY